MFKTTFGHLQSLIIGILPASVAGFLTVHKADGGEDESADVPGGGPAFLVVVGEGGADGHVDVESSGGGVEDEFRCCEGVVLVELDDAVVVAAGIGPFEVMEAEVEVKQPLACDYGVGYGLFVESGLFLHQSLHC